MELMQLQMLVAVADEGTLQKAAERVLRTPPAVSMAIDKLEKELGVSLFERAQGRDLRLTVAGSLLADYARRLLAIRDEALAAIDELRSVRQGTLRIGANQSIGEYLLPHLTNVFHQRHPEIKVRVVIAYSDFILTSLKRHEIDVALVASRPNGNDLRQRLLMPDRLVAILAPGHHLAAREVIRIEELGKEPLILLGETSELRERIVQTFERFRIPMNVQVETATLESIKKMAAQGMGVGIVPRVCVVREEKSGELILRPIREFRERRSLWIATRQNASPACQSFLKLIATEVGSLRAQNESAAAAS